MSKDTFYFPHDYNARSDPKIKKLIRKHGFIGYGIYWGIVEDLYDNANALPTDYETIAYDFRTDEIIIKSIINDFELFVIDGEEFGSRSIERRLQARDAKSLKARESARKRWDKSERNANALPTVSDPNAIKQSKGKENKANESKVKETKETPKKEYGKTEVNEVVNYLTEKLGVTLDGTVKVNRNMANHLINKIKKDYPNKDPVANIKILIDKGLKDNFHGKNITGFQYIYNNLNKIINSIKNETGNSKSKNVDPDDMQAYLKQRQQGAN